MSAIFGLIVSYLLGSLSSAVIVSRLFGFPDPRSQGSGNAGATNVLRTAGKKPAMYVVIADILKGFIAVIIARFIGLQGGLLGLVALAAVIGHIFPVFFNFKGGKGVATAIGGLFGLSLITGIGAAVIWLVVAYVTRYASLASLIALAAGAILTLLFHHPAFFFPVLLMTGLVAWKHKENIDRLKKGTESKINL